MITVIGEAIVDLAAASEGTLLRAVPGGPPLGAAIGAARLGYPTALMARLSRDQFGQLLRRHAAGNGLDLTAAPEADEPTTITVAADPAPGARPAGRSLYFHGTADWQWSAAELAWVPDTTTVLHLGALACCVAPGAPRVLRAARRARGRGALVSLDLSVWPEAMESPGRARLLLERPVRAATVVKTSIEDLNWLYPGRAAEDVARQLLALGPELVVVTCGADGAMAVRSGSVLHRPAYPAQVVDTAGAGDAFTAALLGGLHQLRAAGGSVASLAGRTLASLIDTASMVAGLTCERPGPDLPAPRRPPPAVPASAVPPPAVPPPAVSASAVSVPTGPASDLPLPGLTAPALTCAAPDD